MSGLNLLGTSNNNLVLDPNPGLWGMELPRHEWSVLNRLRTCHGCCADMTHDDSKIVQHVTAVTEQ
jgi:hypothetical protein